MSLCVLGPSTAPAAQEINSSGVRNENTRKS